VLVSDHQPQDVESKNVEFDLAAFGMINLQTAYPTANTILESENTETIIDALSIQPRKILGLPYHTIQENNIANLTIFDPSETYVFTEEDNASLSQNSPFFGIELKGKVLGIVNKHKIFLNKENLAIKE
jgi:dihydroorotase